MRNIYIVAAFYRSYLIGEIRLFGYAFVKFKCVFDSTMDKYLCEINYRTMTWIYIYIYIAN